jgi:dTDP-4-dehydrorhamnose 3,5-epimerase
MKFQPAEIPDIIIIEPDVHRDARGFFLESYNERKYREAGLPATFVQDNHSRSMHRTLRGLHAQRGHPQGKLVRAIEGEIFDVAVDVRRGSPTFGRWIGVRLSAENFKQIYVPPGFAHGFCVLSDLAQVEYKVTDFYDPTDELGLLWNDPEVGIQWPVPEPLLSPKDSSAACLREIMDQLPRYGIDD